MNFRIFVAIAFLGCFSLLTFGCGGSDSGGTVLAVDGGSIQRISVLSIAVGKPMAVNVYLPKGYAEGSSYPVLYIIHGMDGNPDSWIPELGMNKVADALIRQGKIEPLIIVAPQMDNSYGLGRYETFLCEELIRYIDSHYKTDPLREKRFIGGLSMGGFIALRSAFLHVDLYGKVGGHSAALFGYPGITEPEDNPIAIAKSNDVSPLKVFLDCGESDPLYEPTTELFGILQSKGVQSENHIRPGYHNASYWSSHMSEYLIFYAGI